ncbi:MAG: hypothetical protein LUG66_01040 [Clostridiales bacterium]|nr:hypothetical protein [Clostridiales bacterium]
MIDFYIFYEYCIKDIVNTALDSNSFNPYYLLECKICHKTELKDISSFKSNYNVYGERKMFQKIPFCDCNEIKTKETRRNEKLKKLEAEFLKSPYYIPNSLTYVGNHVQYSYYCKKCGKRFDSILHSEQPTFLCQACSASYVGKETIGLLHEECIQWGDKEYFEKNIKNNPNFFPYGNFVAVDFLENDIYERKRYRFRCLKCGGEFDYIAKNMYRGNLKFCPLCQKNMRLSYSTFITKEFLEEKFVEYHSAFVI